MRKASPEYLSIEDVRKRILYRIADCGGKQMALAAKLGVTQSFISAVIAGKKKPSEKILREIGVRQVVLFEDVNSSDQND